MHQDQRWRLHRWPLVLAAAATLLVTGTADAQGLLGALIGSVRDEQQTALPNALVRISSPALIGGERAVATGDKGQLRFAALPPGVYRLEIALQGFTTYREEGLRIGAGATIERTVVLHVLGVVESVVVEGTGSRIDARNPGLISRFGPEDLRTVPTRRASMFDFVRAAPGISPTSPGSGTNTTVSAFGSGTNENQFLIDGTNFTCPCNGITRSEPGVDFIQEIHIQSIGASAEYGNVEGAVINVITRQGGERFAYDASYFGQIQGLTGQPVRRPIPGSNGRESGYERDRYRDFTTNLGGPAIRDRLWFFGGYQYLRDYDSQPGTDPALPRTYEQDKILAKLTWKLAPGLHLMQSLHEEFWVNPDPPTAFVPFETTVRRSASVPAVTFADLTHTPSSNTVWDVRVGRFVYSQDTDPSSGDISTPNRVDAVTGLASGGPQAFGWVTIARTTAKATMSHYRAALLGADHEWKVGGQFERGSHHAVSVIPTGVRYVFNNGRPSQEISSNPSHIGGLFETAAAFASDALTVNERLTINAGLRYDHVRAVSQDLEAIDLEAREIDGQVQGLGTLYTWNLWAPRIGMVAKLSRDGRSLLRVNYGRFNQGVQTGELEPFHPGAAPVTTAFLDPATGNRTGAVTVADNKVNLRIDPHTRAPHTDEYSIALDREIRLRLAGSIAYVHKDGGRFIGWTDAAGQYRQETRALDDGTVVPVLALDTAATPIAARRFLLTNPAGYETTYNGLVFAFEKRRSSGWQVSSSYTWSKATGLLASSGATAAGPQVSTVSPTPALTFGRDPNDLTNARGRLPNDRPHAFRTMGGYDVARIRLLVAANFQYFSGKPWAATALVPLPQTNNQAMQRVLIEPRGARRLSSQSLLDLRVSKTMTVGAARIELLLDVLNALNDSAEEALSTDNRFSPTFAQPTLFIDPRRAMLGVRLTLGR